MVKRAQELDGLPQLPVVLFVARQLEVLFGVDEPGALLVQQMRMHVLGVGAERVEGTALAGLHFTIVGN